MPIRWRAPATIGGSTGSSKTARSWISRSCRWRRLSADRRWRNRPRRPRSVPRGTTIPRAVTPIRDAVMKPLAADRDGMVELTRELITTPTENPPGACYPEAIELLTTRLGALGFDDT